MEDFNQLGTDEPVALNKQIATEGHEETVIVRDGRPEQPDELHDEPGDPYETESAEGNLEQKLEKFIQSRQSDPNWS